MAKRGRNGIEVEREETINNTGGKTGEKDEVGDRWWIATLRYGARIRSEYLLLSRHFPLAAFGHAGLLKTASCGSVKRSEGRGRRSSRLSMRALGFSNFIYVRTRVKKTRGIIVRDVYRNGKRR